LFDAAGVEYPPASLDKAWTWDEFIEVAKRLTIDSNGRNATQAGFDKNNVEQYGCYINQIAFSGASDFVEKYKDNLTGDEIIGHFGLGFYSAFMVSDKVMIESLSHTGGSATMWISDGTNEYEMGPSEKTTRGTEITLYVTEENKDFLMEYKLREILTKYCSYMPVDIFIETIKAESEQSSDGEADSEVVEEETSNPPINKTPLWVKQPSECTDEDYKVFYKESFNDFNDPLFWIHLNMDYPFTLKGILYFPRLKHEFEQIEGTVKLFCNQVFVADNVKEVIPEFLLLLKGVLDCPDIPLNVSRSFLQNDTNVAKMSGYVARKVADKLNSIYKKDKESYTEYWEHISPFIKYGCIKEKAFYDKIEPSILYKTTNDEYVTMDTYLEAAKEKHENIVYYVNDPNLQSQYINMFKDEGMQAVILEKNLDNAFISYLESYKTGVRFNRIDSNIQDLKATDADYSKNDDIINMFKNVVGDKIKLKVEHLKSKSVPAIILQSEQSRRMQEMTKMFGNSDMQLPTDEELVLNGNNDLVKLLVDKQDKQEEVELITNHIYDLATMSYKQLNTEEMSKFVERSNKILELLISK
jgi:molecular chaperone HtpG